MASVDTDLPKHRAHLFGLFPNFCCSFERLREILGLLDRSEAIVWCSRLNLLQSADIPQADRNWHAYALQSLFFSDAEIKAMQEYAAREEKSEPWFAVFNRRCLLELIKWAVLLGNDGGQPGFDLGNREGRRLLVEAAMHTMGIWTSRPFRIHAEPYLQSVEENRYQWSLPVWNDMSRLPSDLMPVEFAASRSRLWLRAEMFENNQRYRERFAEVMGMSVSDYSVCTSLMINFVKAEVERCSGNIRGLRFFRPDDLAGDFPAAGATLQTFFKRQSLTLVQLEDGLRKRLTEQVISENTQLDSGPLRTRPFIRLPDGETVLMDFGFLLDKLWVGPVFNLIHAGEKADDVFSAFGGALEKYAYQLFEAMAERTRGAAKAQVVFSPRCKDDPSQEIADIAVRVGTDLLMVQVKSASFPESLLWSHGDAAYVEKLRERYANPKKGMGQLAGWIRDLADGKISPANPELFAVRRIFPVLLAADDAMASPLHPNFLASEFRKMLGLLEQSPATFVRFGPYEIAVPVLMTLFDLESMESRGYRADSWFGMIETAYEKDSETIAPLTMYVRGALAVLQPKMQPASLTVKTAGEAQSEVDRVAGTRRQQDEAVANCTEGELPSRKEAPIDEKRRFEKARLQEERKKRREKNKNRRKQRRPR